MTKSEATFTARLLMRTPPADPLETLILARSLACEYLVAEEEISRLIKALELAYPYVKDYREKENREAVLTIIDKDLGFIGPVLHDAKEAVSR